ncbi:MAG: toll/interleukin-1 receptor domain-containing protein [Geminicoccaceae bacterium]
MAKLAFSYSHKDEEYRDILAVHLETLRRQGVLEMWHDRKIPVGDELDSTIDRQLDEADVILLLLSPACCTEVKEPIGSGAVSAARVPSPCRTRPMPAAVIISLGRSGA